MLRIEYDKTNSGYQFYIYLDNSKDYVEMVFSETIDSGYQQCLNWVNVYNEKCIIGALNHVKRIIYLDGTEAGKMESILSYIENFQNE